MEGMIMTAQLLLSLSILIVVHEWGHYISARMFKIRVEKFYLFFDFLFPMANVLNFSLFKVKRGDTEFGVGWFPLGGYVKIAGMVDESMDKDQMKGPAQPWEFRGKPAWQRLIVMLGGIIVNVVVGVLIFVGLTYFMGDTYIPKNFVNTHGGIHALQLGQSLGFETGDQVVRINGKDFDDFLDVADPDVLLSADSYYTVLRNGKEIDLPIPNNFIENFNRKEAASSFVSPRIPAVVGETTEVLELQNGRKIKSIASTIGLKPGDSFIEVEGQPVYYQDEVTKIVRARGAAPTDSTTISFKIKRGEEVLAFTQKLEGTQIGFLPMPIDKNELSHIRYGLGESIALGTSRAFGVIFVQLKAFRKIFGGEISLKKSISGPIGMAQAFGTEWDWERFWRMTGLLSMVLAFMNLLPIPALDGGYVMFLLYEMVSGKEPSEKFFETALKIGMAILLLLMVFVFYNDIANIFNRA